MPENLLVVIATYNERENLPDLVSQIESLLPAADVLVIDDNSPDGTGQWCDERKQSDSHLEVIHRSGKLGLGSATVTGFKYALKHAAGYQLVATMDADFSHDPTSLVDLVSFLENDSAKEFGMCIGSRYVSGGRIENWPFARRLSSKAVNLWTRLCCGVKIRDNSGAFRVYRRETLAQIGVYNIASSSYAYLEEIIWRASRGGIRIKELPIVFRDREQGQSKTSLKLGVSVFWHLLKIRLGRVKL